MSRKHDHSARVVRCLSPTTPTIMKQNSQICQTKVRGWGSNSNFARSKSSQMSSFSTRSYCRLRKGTTFRRDPRKPYLHHTKRSSPRPASIQDKIVLVCASSYSWASPELRDSRYTIGSNMCWHDSESAWPLATTNLFLRMNNVARRNRTNIKKSSTKRRSGSPLPESQREEHPSRPCTMSQMSIIEPRVQDVCLERRLPDYETTTPPPQCSRKGVCPTWRWTRTQRLTYRADFGTKAPIRTGMG
jgi:hypothetical protein